MKVTRKLVCSYPDVTIELSLHMLRIIYDPSLFFFLLIWNFGPNDNQSRLNSSRDMKNGGPPEELELDGITMLCSVKMGRMLTTNKLTIDR